MPKLHLNQAQQAVLLYTLSPYGLLKSDQYPTYFISDEVGEQFLHIEIEDGIVQQMIVRNLIRVGAVIDPPQGPLSEQPHETTTQYVLTEQGRKVAEQLLEMISGEPQEEVEIEEKKPKSTLITPDNPEVLTEPSAGLIIP